MLDFYLIVTPILLLAILLIPGFLGCQLVFPFQEAAGPPEDVGGFGGDQQATLTWFSNSGSSYTIFFGAVSGGPYPESVSVPRESGATQHSGTVSGLTNGVPVFFKVITNSPDGNSSLTLSEEVVITPGVFDFVTAQVLGQTGSGFAGQRGMQVDVGARILGVTHLGRMALVGNSQSHAVRIIRPVATSGEEMGSAIVATAVADQPRFVYEPVAARIDLLPNQSYYIVSDEAPGGDVSTDVTTVVTTNPAALVRGGITGADPVAPAVRQYLLEGAQNQTFGPVSFRFVDVLLP